MSLVGTLEELGLGEILQIVSLSRKTGVLSLCSGDRTGSVFFRHGQVVRASSSTYQQSLGEVLIQKGVLDLIVLRKALALQHENNYRERLGTVLVRHFGISQEIIEEVVREQIENVVFSLFAWSEGTFDFQVQSTIEMVDGTKMDPLQFMLDQGLNPQFLAIEGTRILDEKRFRSDSEGSGAVSSDSAADFDFELVAGSNPSAASLRATRHTIVIVDDDGPTLQTIADALTENGFIVHAMTRSEDTLVKVDTLRRSGENPLVIVDLIMPKMDGSGVLGGIELLDLLHNNFKDLRLIVMSDYQHADAEKKVRERGYPFIMKPRRVELHIPGLMKSFISKITHDIHHYSDAVIAGEWQEKFNLGDELRIEMGEDDDMPRAVESSHQSGDLTLLRGMLEELNTPDLQGGVLLLVLRFASEFVNRAIIFTTNDQVISGVGQFGIIGGTISGDERVRSIHVSRESGSMFDEPLRTGQPHTFSPSLTPVNVHIFDQLGGGLPEEVFIGPLISESRIIGFLYGDNLPEMQPIGNIEQLEIFLSQAGVSIEKSLLRQQLNERGTP